DLVEMRRHIAGADAIVCGHTHFDHVLDVPAIARFTGARVFGSRSAVRLCRAAGIAADRLVDVEPTSSEPKHAEVGPFRLTFVPSAHSPFLMRRVPFPGDIADCDQVPGRMSEYRCGAVFAVLVQVAGRSIYHLGSANLADHSAPPLREVDLLLLCTAGWTASRRFVPRLLGTVTPGTIVLSHWDNFLLPLSAGARPLPALQLPRYVEALEAEGRGV